MEDNNPIRLVDLTVDVVVAYLTTHSTPLEDVPGLIATIHRGIMNAAGPAPSVAPAKLEPAVPIKKSVTSDYIICLEDGRRYRSIKRHILVNYGLSPAAYRAKWGLPADYPMVAPGYSAMRSNLAKELGLGFDRLSPTGKGKGAVKARVKVVS